jgi:hypothetical protein
MISSVQQLTRSRAVLCVMTHICGEYCMRRDCAIHNEASVARQYASCSQPRSTLCIHALAWRMMIFQEFQCLHNANVIDANKVGHKATIHWQHVTAIDCATDSCAEFAQADGHGKRAGNRIRRPVASIKLAPKKLPNANVQTRARHFKRTSHSKEPSLLQMPRLWQLQDHFFLHA